MNTPYIIDRFQPKGEVCKSRPICYVKHHGDPLSNGKTSYYILHVLSAVLLE